MRLVRLLPQRWQKLLHEAFKFGIVGGANTILNYAVFNALILTVFATSQLKATVVATVVATISSYLMNRHWTYSDRPKSAMRRETTLFFLFNATGLLIELSVLGIAKYGFGITSLLALNVAKTVGILLATGFRFWTYRTFVFRAARLTSVPGSAGAAPAGSAGAAGSTGSAGAAAPAGSAGAAAMAARSDGAVAPKPDGVSPLVDARRLPSANGEDIETELARSIDAELEAELDAELRAGAKSPTGGRPEGA